MPMPSDAPVSRPSRFLPLFRRTRRPPLTVHTWEWRRVTEAVSEEKQRYRILILSAPIGGGHNAAARVLHAQLSARGHCVTIQDGFRAMSPLLCRLFQWMYPRQLKYFPLSYTVQFALSDRRFVAQAVRWFYGRFRGERLLRFIETHEPDLVISTYPLVTAALGYLRRRGRLTRPCAAVVTDFGVHRLWVSPGVDLHLVLSLLPQPAFDEVGETVRLMKPLASDTFAELPDRDTAREQLGLPPDVFFALVIGGAWGIGNIERIVAHLVELGVGVLVVCGTNRQLECTLRNRYRQHPLVRVYGWTDQIPLFMAAADCLVQNAGGITCLEAMLAQRPIIMYQPIAGHGKRNAWEMERAGAAYYPRSKKALAWLLATTRNGLQPLHPPFIPSEAEAAVSLILALVAASVTQG